MPGSTPAATPLLDPARPEELLAHFASGEKPAHEHRMGLEHEKVGVLRGGVAPGFDVIEPLLGRLRDEAGWTEVREGSHLIALSRKEPGTASASVTLEPGGQLELSDAPRPTATEAAAAVRRHLAELAGPARDLGVRFVASGFRPFGTLDDVPWMPKGRYRVMRAYLPTRGAMAHEMMKRTATVQVNLDYTSQADCARKLRTALGVSPLVTSLFAASPLVDGRATDHQSWRAAAWLATDEDRCGLLPFAFDDGAEEDIYRRYAEWALDVPLFFVYRDGEYRPAHEFTFRRFLAEGFHGERATAADWELHLSTLFPEVRLKRYLEIRSADASTVEMVTALPALMRGVLFCDQAREAAWALVRDLPWAERQRLRAEVPRTGLRTRLGNDTLLPRCQELLRIAREGLLREGAEADAALLAPLEEVARTGRTRADVMRDLHASLGGDPDALTDALALPLG